MEFSEKHDVIVFVSGKKSSNGKMLFESCKSKNSNSYFISDVDEINKKWFLQDDDILRPAEFPTKAGYYVLVYNLKTP